MHTALESPGLEPHLLGDTLLTSMYGIIERHKHRVDLDLLAPSVQWREARDHRAL